LNLFFTFVNADFNNPNLLAFGVQNEAFSSDLQSQVDFSGALAQAFQLNEDEPPVQNRNVSVLCNSFDAMSTECENPSSSAQTTTVPSTSYQSQINSTDFILSDLFSESDFQMLSFSASDSNHEKPSEDITLKSHDNNGVLSDSAVSTLSPSDIYDSGSDNLSNFEDQLNDFPATNSQPHQSATHAQLDEGVELASAVALPVAASENNNTYFECLDANNCTLNYDFYLRNYDLSDPVTNFNGNALNDFAAPVAQFSGPESEQASLPVQCDAFDNVMHNHSYTVMTPTASAEALPSNTESYAPVSFAYQSSEGPVDAFSFDNYSSMNNSRKGAASASMDSYSVTSESPSEEDRCISRDERKARELQIPITVADIINLPIDEFNERLSRYDLSEAQLNLIRDIRRRGKNKVAAQNCRKRKMDQILGLQQEVDHLYRQKNSLLAYSDRLFSLRDMAYAKYQKLYDFVHQTASGSALTALQYNFAAFAQGSQMTSSASNGNRASMYNETMFVDQHGSESGYLVNSTSSSDPSSSALTQNSFKKALLAIN
jgi:hypothetical protein